MPTLTFFQMPVHTPAPVEVANSRTAIAEAIREVLPHVHVGPATLILARREDGWQVSLPMFGPVGALTP
jgi:hypothetical protein